MIKEVFTIDVVAARQWRTKTEEELIRQEKKSRDYYLHDSIAWLKVADEQQDDELTRLCEKRQKGTCEWVFKNEPFQVWKDDPHGDPILWVKGIPGAGEKIVYKVQMLILIKPQGKTILSTYIIHRFQEESAGFTASYHICNSYTTGKNLLGELLRSLAVQLLRENLELAPYIFDNYANKGLAPSIVRLRKLLPELLGTIPSVRLIVDGLDEYPESDQRSILSELISLSKSSGGQFRVLFSNRESELINKTLDSKSTISLKDQHADVTKDIQAYLNASLEDFRPRFGDRLIDTIERRIVSKSNGEHHIDGYINLLIESQACFCGCDL